MIQIQCILSVAVYIPKLKEMWNKKIYVTIKWQENLFIYMELDKEILRTKAKFTKQDCFRKTHRSWKEKNDRNIEEFIHHWKRSLKNAINVDNFCLTKVALRDDLLIRDRPSEEKDVRFRLVGHVVDPALKQKIRQSLIFSFHYNVSFVNIMWRRS